MSDLTVRAIRAEFLHQLSEMPLDHITVTGITKSCGISRNTFYYHYHDVYEVLDDVLNLEHSQINQILEDRSRSWHDAFLNATRFAWENQRAVYHIYNSVSRNKLEAYLWDTISTCVRTFVEIQAEGLSPAQKDIDNICTIYTAALSGMMTDWLRNGMKNDPRDILDTLHRLADGITVEMLSRSCG